MVLLGEVDELEVERERPQDVRLPLGRQGSDRLLEPRPRGRRAARPRATREVADALLGLEQPRPALLDEYAPEDVAEQADVAPEWSVGGARVQGRVTAPSLADETCAAYFASTPLA